MANARACFGLFLTLTIAPTALAAAPVPRLPADGARATSNSVDFRWTGAAPRYELRLSRSPAFDGVYDYPARRPGRTVVLDDGVWYWKVRTVDGSPSPWSPARRVRVVPVVDVVAPKAPSRLRVVARTAGSVTVRWRRARDRHGIRAYEILVDGSVARRVRGRRARAVVALECSSPVVAIRVVAIDRSGNRSQPSAPARARTLACSDGTPPSAPGAAHVVSVTDTTVVLGWEPATDDGGRVGDYLVERNGAVLGRPRSTLFVASRLAPDADYVFSVRARDRAGLLGPAATIAVHTLRPGQANGRLHAYELASDGASFASLDRNYRTISWVYPTTYEVRTDAQGMPLVDGTLNQTLRRFAELRGVKVLPRFHSEDPTVLRALLTNAAARDALVAQIRALTAQTAVDGANIDFEGGICASASDCDAAAMTRFVQDLARALHADGRLLSVAVSAKRGDPAPGDTRRGRADFYDYRAIAEYADEVFVLAWNPHYATSMPGPVGEALVPCGAARCSWLRSIVDYTRSLGIDMQRFTFGTAFYGFDWAYRRIDGRIPQETAPVDLRVGGVSVGATTTVVDAGTTLTVAPGAWTTTDGSPLTYDWRRCPSYRDTAACETIRTAGGQTFTGTSYTVGAGDVGKYLYVRETARNGEIAAIHVTGVRTAATLLRPLREVDGVPVSVGCQLTWPDGIARRVMAKPIVDAPDLEGFIGQGLGCLTRPGIPREHTNDIPADVPGFDTKTVGVTQLLARLRAAGTPVREAVDPATRERVAVWTDAAGDEHQLWWIAAASVDARYGLTTAAGARIGAWRLGREDPAIWTLPILGASS